MMRVESAVRVPPGLSSLFVSHVSGGDGGGGAQTQAHCSSTPSLWLLATLHDENRFLGGAVDVLRYAS